MSVINILMQLRKVCNHPDLFEPRPILSPFVTEAIECRVPSRVFNLQDELFADQLAAILALQPSCAAMEYSCSLFTSHRAMSLQVSKRTIEEVMAAKEDLGVSGPDLIGNQGKFVVG